MQNFVSKAIKNYSLLFSWSFFFFLIPARQGMGVEKDGDGGGGDHHSKQ